MKSKELTAQQKNFISEYIKDLDAERAAVTAGYKKSTAAQKAKELLAKPEIIKEMKKLIEFQAKSLMVSKLYIIKKLLNIAEFCLETEDILDKEGNPSGKRKLRDTGAGLRALEFLSKHLGFYKPEKTDDDSSPQINTIINLDEDRI